MTYILSCLSSRKDIFLKAESVALNIALKALYTVEAFGALNKREVKKKQKDI